MPGVEENQTGQTPEVPEQQVDVHEADIASLDAALQAAQAEERAEAEKASAEVPETPAAENPSIQTQQPSGQSVDPSQASPSADPQKTNPSDVAPQGANPATQAKQYTPEQIQGIIAEHERRANGGVHKESFVQNRKAELNQHVSQIEARRQILINQKAQLENGLEDKWSVNPSQASRDEKDIADIQSELDGLDSQENRLRNIVEAQSLFVQNIDTNSVTPNDMAEVLRTEGVPEEHLARFVSNPWEFMSPDALVRLGRQAQLAKDFKAADSDRRVLADHVLHLNEELKKAKENTTRTFSAVQNRLNSSPSVTAASGQSSRASQNFTPGTIERMPIDQLNQALSQAAQNG